MLLMGLPPALAMRAASSPIPRWRRRAVVGRVTAALAAAKVATRHAFACWPQRSLAAARALGCRMRRALASRGRCRQGRSLFPGRARRCCPEKAENYYPILRPCLVKLKI